MLLSVDWDAFSGTRELVFDAPIWGTPDREADRLEVWRARMHKRGGTDWSSLEDDFPLYPGWRALEQYAGVPTWVALSHAEAWSWLEFFEPQEVLNIDSHHDLTSFSGDGTRLRPGNWAGLALAAGRITRYTCEYPAWHATLPVAEGYDLERTRSEVAALLPPQLMPRVRLLRADRASRWPGRHELSGILLVQSPAWTSPAHDPAFQELHHVLQAQVMTPPLVRVH